MKVETLRWFNNRLEMVDQRILPAAFEYLSYYTAASVAEGIRSMVVRGAPAIGVAAAYGVALEALKLSNALEGRHSGLDPESSAFNKLDSRFRGNDDAVVFNAGMEEGFKVLAASRPTAVNLFWALQRMRKLWEGIATLSPQEIA
ncbi:MAG: S-methyl-5-thioribose-1-phosphate isomerase, partial [Sideroxydans sp.]|nr:S-methyl-5-thioribose-1-phosphate isomerase [Sideroxydans sp.]